MCYVVDLTYFTVFLVSPYEYSYSTSYYQGKQSKRQNRPKKGSPQNGSLPSNLRMNAFLHRNPGFVNDALGPAQWRSLFQTSVKCLPPEVVVEKIRKGCGPTHGLWADHDGSGRVHHFSRNCPCRERFLARSGRCWLSICALRLFEQSRGECP